MFPVLDVTDWEAEPEIVASGRRPKEWVVEPRTRQHALLKFPHYHEAESAAEKVASEVAAILQIPAAHVALAVRGHRYGIISYSFVQKYDSLVEGGSVITALFPHLARTARRQLFQVVASVLPISQLRSFISLLVLDATIGNSDRHQDNWGLILPRDGDRYVAPSYDHGSSLARDVPDGDAGDEPSLERYVRRGHSRVTWQQGVGVRRCTHIEILQLIREAHPNAVDDALATVRLVDKAQLFAIPYRVPEPFATPHRRQLMSTVLRLRLKLLEEAFDA